MRVKDSSLLTNTLLRIQRWIRGRVAALVVRKSIGPVLSCVVAANLCAAPAMDLIHVHARMLFFVHQLKILQTIIFGIAIFMVHDIAVWNRMAEVLFHNKSMPFYVFPVLLCSGIFALFTTAHVFAIALLRTIITSAVGMPPEKPSATICANFRPISGVFSDLGLLRRLRRLVPRRPCFASLRAKSAWPFFVVVTDFKRLSARFTYDCSHNLNNAKRLTGVQP